MTNPYNLCKSLHGYRVGCELPAHLAAHTCWVGQHCLPQLTREPTVDEASTDAQEDLAASSEPRAESSQQLWSDCEGRNKLLRGSSTAKHSFKDTKGCAGQSWAGRQARAEQNWALHPWQPEGSGHSCLPLLLAANMRPGTESCLPTSLEQPSDGVERGATI